MSMRGSVLWKLSTCHVGQMCVRSNHAFLWGGKTFSLKYNSALAETLVCAQSCPLRAQEWDTIITSYCYTPCCLHSQPWIFLPKHRLIWPCDCHCQLSVPMAKLCFFLLLIGLYQAMSLSLEYDWSYHFRSRLLTLTPPSALPVQNPCVWPRAELYNVGRTGTRIEWVLNHFSKVYV